MSTTPDICHDFAAVVANARYESLSEEAIDGAKKSVLDTLGVTLAASGMEPAVKNLVGMVQENGGRPECSILGFGGKVPAEQAAFANGAMAHCLDFDDQTPWGAHSASSIIPAVFALAQRKGGISGRDLILAVAIGQDLFVRLRCNVGWQQGWNLSSMVGVFSATAAASRVLGLDQVRAAHALGIASMQSCCTMEVILGIGSDLRGMYAGFTAKGTVVAALLAERGVTGIDSLFEGQAGIFKTYFNGTYNREKMLEGLGSQFLGGTTLYKAWPAVGNSHTYIHATIELMKEHGLRPDDIEQIRVHVGDFTQVMCTPLDTRRAPATLVDAKFSLPFLVGVAAANGSMGISDFSATALQDSRVREMAKRVVPVEDKTQNWEMKLPDGRVEILTRDGRRFGRVGDNIPGSAEVPLTWDQLLAKFKDCASVAAARPSEAGIRRAQDLAQRLETVEDATELLVALS